MRFRIATTIPASAEPVWEHLQRPATMVHLLAPLVRVDPRDPDPLPERWTERDHVVSLWLFGLVPIGPQTIRPEILAIDGWPKAFVDHGHSPLIRRWHHRLELMPDGPDRCQYADELDIDAGVLTPLVWLFARGLFAHRQRRWRSLARNGFAALSPA